MSRPRPAVISPAAFPPHPVSIPFLPSLFQESLRPDLISSNLNRTHSSSGELNAVAVAAAGGGGWTQQRVSYNDLCFPKTSNYGSMKKKKHHNVGVDCRLNYGNNNRGGGVGRPATHTPSPLASHSTSYY